MPDLQISDYQVERYSNDVGHGREGAHQRVGWGGLTPFTVNRLKFRSRIEHCSLFSMRAGNLLIHEVGWN